MILNSLTRPSDNIVIHSCYINREVKEEWAKLSLQVRRRQWVSRRDRGIRQWIAPALKVFKGYCVNTENAKMDKNVPGCTVQIPIPFYPGVECR